MWAPASELGRGHRVLRCWECFGQKAASWARFSPWFSFCSSQSGALSSVFLLQPPRAWQIAIMKGNDTVWGAGFHLEPFKVV